MSKEVILTGIRANNDLHIGNYFGALLPIIDMAKNRSSDFQINLFVPDLHSFTTPIDNSQLQAQTMNNLKIFAGAGLPLDNPDIRIYRQSYIPAHSELTWILDCFTSFGEMRRMIQFKEKAYKTDDDDEITSSVGLFNYPVLMAADILLYGAKYVPVGDDQTQHLEFTRNIAERMNNQFRSLFVVPEPVAKQHEFFGKDQGLRIKDLADPTKKMSKSDEHGRGVIFLGDDPDDAVQKIKSATTDSFSDGIKLDHKERPGISNLVQIHDLISPEAHDEILSATNYQELKSRVAETVRTFLGDFQAKLKEIDEAMILKKLEADEQAMNKIAQGTLYKVQQAVGLRPRA
ncbi:MAG TPA: tryptophan--tRNA ligase [Candidatus Babeliales bacterium]|nr:tryptophan--tRNA ligase [Candidatus Babeliales bacterium]